MRKKEEFEQQRIERLLARLRRHTPPIPEHELRAMARSATAESRQLRPGEGPGSGASRWRLGLRWTAVAVVAALLLGSGLGFGLGSSVTPDGSAGTNLVGLGFLPARGWTVVQSGTVGSTGSARAIAANVPLNRSDDLSDTPYATLKSLPVDGVLIEATFTTRGNAEEDVNFPVRRLPLEMAAAIRKPKAEARLPFARRLAEFRLRAGVGGYNIDARLYFATAQPSAKLIAAAQRQLTRLVVGSERVTILARPAVVGGRTVHTTLFGSVDSGKADEDVAIQAKDCGLDFFRAVAGARTKEGGGWSTQYVPLITTTLRAVWNDAASAQITVRQRARVQLIKRQSTGGFEVWVVGKKQFWRKHALFQRFDRRLGTWSTVKSVVLTETGSNDGSSGTVWSRGKLSIAVPKGTLVRAVFPLSQARPCYLAGVSETLRT